MAACKSRPQPFRPVVITVPFGAVDPVLNVSRISPAPAESNLELHSTIYQSDARNPHDTTSRLTYQKRSAGDVARTMAGAARQVAESKAVKVRVCLLYTSPSPRDS